MTWNDDELEYGYVVTRPPSGGWWHLHFGNAGVEYDCEFLGRRTCVFALVQYFAAGAQPLSPGYVLTLDGYGVEIPDFRLDFSWGRNTHDPEMLAEARHFQESVMPSLYDSTQMQRAIAELVSSRRHLRQLSPDKLLPSRK